MLAGLQLLDGDVALAEAELALKQGELEQVLAVTDALLTELRQYGMRLPIAYSLYLQGQALRGLNQDQAARDRLLEGGQHKVTAN